MATESETRGAISHYRLIERIGQGAMGEVWLADDTQLPRKVAIKLLPRHLAEDSDACDRLLREAQAAASVDHPGVVTVFDSGVVDGRPFIVMQRVEGETLAERLARGPLPIGEAVAFARSIADALAEVHALGIVHRDLKPSNIMLTARGPKILDFGIASIKGAPQLTSAGVAVGTPAAMSPEQALGRPLDNRCDLWALGVILYHCLTGRPPFEGTTAAAVLRAVLDTTPAPPSRLRAEVGTDLDYIVMKLLRKDPAHRYARAEDVLADIATCEQCAAPDATPAPASRGLLEDDTLAIRTRSLAVPRIAVLYFDVMSADPHDAFLAAGLTEDLIVDLTRVEGVHVAGRAEVMPYRDRPVPARTLGRELGVSYVVHGSVRRAGSRARISVQMVRASDGHVLGAERFDRNLDDLFEVQAEVSKRIVDVLQLALRPDEREMLDRVPTRSREAYEEYLRARQQLDMQTREGNFLAEELLKSAIARDDRFALAHAALGETYGRRGNSWWGGLEVADLALPHAERALELEPNLLEGHLARAMVYRVRGEHERLIAAIEKILELDPNHGEALEWSGWSYLSFGSPEKAKPILERLSVSHPHRYVGMSYLAACYELLGQHDDARRANEMTRDRCVEILRRQPEQVHCRSILGTTLVQLGEVAAGITQAERAVAIAPGDGRIRYNLACVYARAMRVEDSIEQLKEAVRNVPGFVADWPRHDPDLKNVHGHPEFIRLFGSA